jgi:hypothetical protein
MKKVTQEFEEREHAHKRKKKTEQEERWYISSGEHLLKSYYRRTHTFRVPLIRTTPYGAHHPWLAAHAHATRHYALPGPTAFYLALRPSTITWPYGLLPLPPYREHAPTSYYSGGITLALPCLEDVPTLYPTHGAGTLAYPIHTHTYAGVHTLRLLGRPEQCIHPIRIHIYLTMPI